MKTCCGCNKEKPLDDFYRTKRSKDGRQPRCKICMRDAYNASRNKRKDHYNAVRNKRERLNAARLNEWKQELGCTYCSEDDPCCLDIHHTDPKEKDFAISDRARYLSWETLTEEINKGIVVCRNCHAKIHAGILGD